MSQSFFMASRRFEDDPTMKIFEDLSHILSKTFMREVDLCPDSPQRKSGDCPGQQFIPRLGSLSK